MDVDVLQCLHGRAPACATGIKRMRPDLAVFTLQGDGDMANEGLQEVLHAAARGEKVTCVMLNNGVFGDTGGQQTATTVVGQRTKTSLDGRDPETAGYPIPVADLVAQLRGAAYVARSAVSTAAGVAQTKRMLRKAFQTQLSGAGFSLVEILTMCPTGWFVPAVDGPGYQGETMEQAYPIGELVTP
jgi:2-oxoglutarate ferredoxin oxidoreductase subunit beta